MFANWREGREAPVCAEELQALCVPVRLAPCVPPFSSCGLSRAGPAKFDCLNVGKSAANAGGHTGIRGEVFTITCRFHLCFHWSNRTVKIPFCRTILSSRGRTTMSVVDRRVFCKASATSLMALAQGCRHWKFG